MSRFLAIFNFSTFFATLFLATAISQGEAVNATALRQAIEDLSDTFGDRYPLGDLNLSPLTKGCYSVIPT